MKYLVHERREVIYQIESFKDSKPKETDLINSEVVGYSVETREPNNIVLETEYLVELLDFLLENDQTAVENGEYGVIYDNGYKHYTNKELLNKLTKESYFIEEGGREEPREAKIKHNTIKREIMRRMKND